MLKIYQSRNTLSLVTRVRVGEQTAEIAFTGGVLTPQRRNGRFVTEDESLQQAIEQDGAYGKEFELCYVQQPAVHKAPQRRQMCVEEVTTKQMAIEWLRIHKKGNFTAATHNRVIRGFAEEQGVVFPNWNVSD